MMPLPWKKVRSGKISQLVNDHFHHSQKRRDGSSLVVETGFPTSLVDLFIKNREKLSKRKVIRRSLTNSDAVILDDVVGVRQGRFLKGVGEIVALVEEASDDHHVNIVSDEIVVVASDDHMNVVGASDDHMNVVGASDDHMNVVGASDGRKDGLFECVGDGRRNGVDVNGVIGMVLKVVLVVGLAWGIKKMTMGITLSAFLLFLMDYLGRCVEGCLRPWFGDKGVFRALQFVKKSNRGEGGKEERCGVGGIGEREIQPVEWDVVGRVEEIRLEEEVKGDDDVVEGGVGFRETKLKELLLENDEFVCVVGKKSKKEKIKSKVRKCFVRRIRSFRKDEHFPGTNGSVPEVRSSSSSEELVGSDSGSGSGRSSVDRSVSVDLAAGGFSGVSDEVAVRKEALIKKLEPSVQVWSCLVLGLIVLVGLVRGRIFALMLTITWCLLLKLGQTLPICRKVFRIRSLK